MAIKYSSKFAMVIMYQHNYVHFQLQSSQLKKKNIYSWAVTGSRYKHMLHRIVIRSLGICSNSKDCALLIMLLAYTKLRLECCKVYRYVCPWV